MTFGSLTRAQLAAWRDTLTSHACHQKKIFDRLHQHVSRHESRATIKGEQHRHCCVKGPASTSSAALGCAELVVDATHALVVNMSARAEPCGDQGACPFVEDLSRFHLLKNVIESQRKAAQPSQAAADDL